MQEQGGETGDYWYSGNITGWINSCRVSNSLINILNTRVLMLQMILREGRSVLLLKDPQSVHIRYKCSVIIFFGDVEKFYKNFKQIFSL